MHCTGTALRCVDRSFDRLICLSLAVPLCAVAQVLGAVQFGGSLLWTVSWSQGYVLLNLVQSAITRYNAVETLLTPVLDALPMTGSIDKFIAALRMVRAAPSPLSAVRPPLILYVCVPCACCARVCRR
jgi:hypothetical protein